MSAAQAATLTAEDAYQTDVERNMRVGVSVVPMVTVSAGALTSQGGSMVKNQRAASDPDNALVGTWRVVSFESRTADGQSRQLLGRTPKGQLQYDASGYMSAHLMDPDRPRFASDDQARGSDAEVRAAVAGYIAYYGTYTVNWAQGIVTHHVEGALFPNWMGRDQVCYFRLDGNRLTITTPPILMDGQTSTTVLVFQRAL